MDTHEAEPTQKGCSLVSLLSISVLATTLAVVVSYGWRQGGWRGLGLGLLVGVPLATVVSFVAVWLVGMTVLGLCALINPREFRRLINEKPGDADVPDERVGGALPDDSEPQTSKADAPPSRRGRFRIRPFMGLTALLAVWMSVGLAMVRYSKTQQEKEKAVAVVVLVPIGFFANYHAQRWLESRSQPKSNEPTDSK